MSFEKLHEEWAGEMVRVVCVDGTIVEGIYICLDADWDAYPDKVVTYVELHTPGLPCNYEIEEDEISFIELIEG